MRLENISCKNRILIAYEISEKHTTEIIVTFTMKASSQLATVSNLRSNYSLSTIAACSVPDIKLLETVSPAVFLFCVFMTDCVE